jgi:glycosyltransferase involved in cell wall biosynthesis
MPSIEITDQKRIVVLCDNEFWKAPRVNRTAVFLASTFGQLSVISGVTEPVAKRMEQFRNITIYRHRYFKPTYGEARVVKWATAIALGSDDRKVSLNGENRIRSLSKTLLISMFFLGWFLYLVVLNLSIVVRFIGLVGDLYYANDLDTLLAGYLLTRLHRARLIYDAHELYPDLAETSPDFYRFLLKKVEGYLARRADAVITVNDPIAEILQDRHRLERKPTVVLNCPPFQPVPERVNASLPLYKVLYHGLYLPGRNLEGLVLSMRYVENAQLYLRGYGMLEGTLRRIVDQNGLRDKVIFLAPVPMSELVPKAAEFDIGIVPYPGNPLNLNSYFCGPNKVFEYLMAGLALAVSDLPELRKIVDQYDVGIVFDPDSPRDIARALAELTEESLQRMQANALAAARETFNFEREAEKLHRVIQGIGFSAVHSDHCEGAVSRLGREEDAGQIQ